MKKQKRCFQCMELYAEGQICPVCGFDHSKYQSSLDALQPGTILRGRYFVGMRLNQNQIENAYLAWDNLEETAVTIREYYPTELVRRDLTGEQGNKLLVPEGEAGKRYQKGMKGFVREARALVQFSAMPGVLMGKEFFHENNTAYLIQERRKGITLAEYIQENGKMKPEKALRGMKPVLRSLDRLHRAGIFHQNINPDHIIVSENGEMLLTDFGTVRMLEYSGEREPGRFLQRGYAPAEQYQMQEQCDAAADVYAVCAVFYYMMTAEAPEDAEKREEGARLKPFADYGVSLSKERRRVLRKGLAVSKDRRCQTMRELYQALYGFEKNKWFLRLGCGLAVLLLLIVLLGKAVISLEQNKTAETNQAEDVVDSSQQEEKKTFTMTDVTGLLLKEAKKEIAARNSELLIQVKKEYSESVRKGYVIGQSVAANTTFQEGEIETIVLTVSKGSQKVVVPDVTGMLKEDAMKKIHKAGLKYKIVAYSQNDTVAFGAVIRQKPVEGEKAKKGSYVKIWVSLG